MTRNALVSLGALLLGLGLLGVAAAKADPAPPTVSYAVTGSSQDYTLDFTVDNNTNQVLYFFGVSVPDSDVTGASSVGGGWCTSPVCDTPWITDASAISFNNVWVANDGISAGASASGFTVLDTVDATAPTGVDWFAYTIGGYTAGDSSYTGGGNYDGDTNPLFLGVAGAPVPEPGSLSLLLTAVVGLALAPRRKRAPRSASPRQ